MCPPGLAESNSRLKRVSVGQCLKFRDDTPSFATLSTLNNSQDLYPDYWRPVFWFNKLWHMEVHVSNQLTVAKLSTLKLSVGLQLVLTSYRLAMLFVVQCHVKPSHLMLQQGGAGLNVNLLSCVRS